jgi:hypothetical protein
MPFSPLPKIFLDDLERLSARGVLELGSGDGGFTELLRRHGVDAWTVDRRSRQSGALAMIRGDALHLPLKGPFGLVLAANLLRHLWRRARCYGPIQWRDIVADGGCLWIFEDEPIHDSPAADHYRKLQELLAGLDGTTRAPLLASQDFRKRRDIWNWHGTWTDGSGDNDWKLSAADLLNLLSSGHPKPGGTVARLISAIERDGISCGRFWWSRWRFTRVVPE